jgi:hypothetical protein
MQNNLPESCISVHKAAQRLRVTPQTVRNRIRAGKLDGWKDVKGFWLVSAATVERMSAPPAAPGELLALVGALADELAELQNRADDADRLAAALDRERDRYRADAAAAREAALLLTGNARDLDAATRKLLAALEAQREALVQLLAPRTADDLVDG